MSHPSIASLRAASAEAVAAGQLSSIIDAIDRFLSYTPTGRTDWGYALGWATAQHMLLARLVEAGVLTTTEARWLEPALPDRKFLSPRRGRPVGGMQHAR